MRIAIAVLAVSLVASTMAHAEPATSPGLDDLHPPAQARGARTLEVTGITFTTVALLTEVATFGLWVNYFRCFDHCAETSELARRKENGMNAAIATSAVVPVLLGIGLATWGVGAHRREARRDTRITLTAGGLRGTF